MTQTQIHKVKIEDLAIEETIAELYPRSHVDFRRVLEYAQAMKVGAVFPPIHVGIFKEKNYVPDGLHRIKAKQMLKQKEIDCTFREYNSIAEMYQNAVRLNSTHGMSLKFYERAIAMRRMLEEFKLPKRKVSEILGVLVPKFTVFLERTYIKDGKIYAFKSSIWKAMKKQQFNEDEIEKVSENIDQTYVTSTQIKSVLREFLQAIENNLIPLHDPEVKELAAKIYEGLQGLLSLD